jgi:hypothetical protein
MKGRLVLALAVAVAAGSVQVNYDGKDYSLAAGEQRVFAEEGRGKRERPKVENPLPEAVRGFVGMVKGTVAAKNERGFDLKVTAVLKTWEGNKAPNPAALVGMTIKVTAMWSKGEGDKWRQNEVQLAFIRKLEVGQELTVEIKNIEREVFAILELTKEQTELAKAGREEPRKEEPRKEEPRKEGESIVGKKLVFSDRAAQATFSGVVAGREGGNLKIKIAESADKRLPAGETVTFFAQWEQVEGKWRVSRAYGEVIERLRAGDKVEGGAFFDEHPRLAYITVTARGEGEKKPEEKKKPEPKKTEGDEF